MDAGKQDLAALFARLGMPELTDRVSAHGVRDLGTLLILSDQDIASLGRKLGLSVGQVAALRQGIRQCPPPPGSTLADVEMERTVLATATPAEFKAVELLQPLSDLPREHFASLRVQCVAPDVPSLDRTFVLKLQLLSPDVALGLPPRPLLGAAAAAAAAAAADTSASPVPALPAATEPTTGNTAQQGHDGQGTTCAAQSLRHELSVLRSVRPHPGIVRLLSAFVGPVHPTLLQLPEASVEVEAMRRQLARRPQLAQFVVQEDAPQTLAALRPRLPTPLPWPAMRQLARELLEAGAHLNDVAHVAYLAWDMDSVALARLDRGAHSNSAHHRDRSDLATLRHSRVILSDFSRAMAFRDASLVATTDYAGLPRTCPEYLCPEMHNAARRMAQNPEARADVAYLKAEAWALGTLLMHIALGEHPLPGYPDRFRGAGGEVAVPAHAWPAAAPADFPPEFVQLLKRLTDAHMQNRPSLLDARAIFAALVDVAGEETAEEDSEPAPAAAAVPPLGAQPDTLPLGTVVRRGPDWRWGDQDGGAGSTGRVCIGGAQQGWLRVKWDAGSANVYRWSAGGCHDLEVVTLAPERPETLAPGTAVRRGPDWEWGEQDGGVGSTGRVASFDQSKGIAWVTWSNGRKADYRWGANGRFDLLVVAPAPAVGDAPAAAAAAAAAATTAAAAAPVAAAPAPAATVGAAAAFPPLLPGTIVRRGPDWKWAMQDGGPGSTGRVLSMSDTPGWVKVRWDNGGTNGYRWGVSGKRDLEVVTPPAPEVLPDGARVRRGADWKWGEQDGGAGTVGVVTRTDTARKLAWVRWPSGQEMDYRWGLDGCYDLELATVAPSATLPIGTVVRRGPDWKWGEQDGGAGTLGRVCRVAPERQLVWVFWPHGKTFDYRWGAAGCHDLEVVTLAPERPETLAPGTVVRRGADWKWGEQDGGAGTLGRVQPRAGSDGCLSVKWASGSTNTYRWGAEGCFDVEVAPERPATLPLGTVVRRGPDWKWAKQDGGAGKVGRVCPAGISSSGWVSVRWDMGSTNGYRWGADDCYDLEVVTLAPERPAKLPVGTAVRRGPDWKWGDQDGGAGKVGYVQEHDDADEHWVKVRWGDVDTNVYRWGADGCFDLEVVGDAMARPRVLPDGARVRRGTDWKWGEQDGGAGTVGVVTRTDAARKLAWVRWPSGQEMDYRWGLDGCHDLEVVATLPIGTVVRRGPDWTWGEQDGGAGAIGTVQAHTDHAGWVRVAWKSGHVNSYHWGADGRYDLEVVGKLAAART